MSTEPSTIVGFITAFVAALISLAVAFGFDLTDDQRNSILGLTAVVAPLIAAVIIRSRVFSPASTKAIAEEAAQTGTVPASVK